MVAGGMRLRLLRRGGRFLLAKPLFLPLLRIFSKFRRFYRERGKVLFIPVRHCVRQEFSPFAVRFARC